MFALYNRSVQLTSGLKEFVGKVGTIVGLEDLGRPGDNRLYRIRLNTPVRVEGVGVVRDDLWERQGFKLLRD